MQGDEKQTNKRFKKLGAHKLAFDECMPEDVLLIIWDHVLDSTTEKIVIYGVRYPRWKYSYLNKQYIRKQHKHYAICKEWVYRMKSLYRQVEAARERRLLSLESLPKGLLGALGGLNAAFSLPVLGDLINLSKRGIGGGTGYVDFVTPDDMPFPLATGIHCKRKVIFLNLVYKSTGENGVLAIFERHSVDVDASLDTKHHTWVHGGFNPRGKWYQEFMWYDIFGSNFSLEKVGKFVQDLLERKQDKFILKHF